MALGFMVAGSLLRSVLPWITQITPWSFADHAEAVAQGQVDPTSVLEPSIGTMIEAGMFIGGVLPGPGTDMLSATVTAPYPGYTFSPTERASFQFASDGQPRVIGGLATMDGRPVGARPSTDQQCTI